MTHDHKGHDKKEEGGCCGGTKPEQTVQQKIHNKEPHDQKEKNPQKIESETQGGCCGGGKK